MTIKARAAGAGAIPRLEVVDERLDYVRRSGQGPVLPFARGKKAWRDSVLRGKRTSPFISTEQAGGETFIRVHEDSGHQGRARKVKADGLGRTVLSTLNTAETPTALVARREMQSWQLLQLEPARLRGPDDLKAGARLGPDGRGLAATLQRLLAVDGGAAAGAARARLAQRLLELNDDVEDVWVDRDEGREALTLMARSRDGVEFRARDLSDGTLRFLALAVLEQDPTWSGLLCLEEPENGIHPTRLPAMLELLGDMAADLDRPAGADNPLRQVIVNTHSPQVVGLAPDDCMIFAGSEPGLVQGQRIRSLSFLPLDGTWRAAGGAARSVSKEAVLQFLNVLPAVLEEEEGAAQKGRGRRPRVAERDGIRQMLLFPGEEAP
ncbi:MAG: AAA family ATPase [Planctomycetes bacterium]|nr:AAA family ATPase [Planctomycetota bacterium]